MAEGELYTLCGTGHRPNKLGGYSQAVKDQLRDLARWALLEAQARRGPLKVHSGMAQGWDWALAEACCELELTWVAAVPFVGQEAMWPQVTQREYQKLLGLASEVVTVSEGGYSAAKMQARNEWMLRHSEAVLALWDGSPGGTGNCLKAVEPRHIVWNLWSEWLKRGGGR